MEFGAEAYRQDSSVMLSGLTVGGVLVDVLKCGAVTNGSKDYPNTQAPNLRMLYVKTTGAHQISTATVNTGTGLVARVSWNYLIDQVQTDTIIYIFNMKPALGNEFGIEVVNDAGQVLADQTYPAPQYAGKAFPTTTATRSYVTPEGYNAHVHSYGSVNMRPGADQLILMAMPEVAGHDTWYHMPRTYILGEEGAVPVELIVYTKATSYEIPTLHFFAVNKPTISGDAYGWQLTTASGQLTFDAGAENMGNLLDLAVSSGGEGTTSSHSIPVMTLPGLMVPYRKQFIQAGDTKRTLVSAGKKQGGQFTMTMLVDRVGLWSSGSVAYSEGLANYTPVVNLSAQLPVLYTGTPGPTESKPQFTQQPVSAYVEAGDSAVFNVTVSGALPISLQWQLNGTDIPGATGTSVTLTGGSENSTDYVRCRASNELGITYSNEVMFIVTGVVPADITSFSGPASAYAGDSVTFSVTASGSPVPFCEIIGAGGLYASGYGSASITTTATLAMSGNVMWKASNADTELGAVDSVNRSFTVTNRPEDPPTPAPVFTTSPVTQSVYKNDPATFTAAASNTSSYAWYRGTTYVGDGASHAADTSVVGTFSYRVDANGPGGTTSKTATLTVSNPPPPTPAPVFSSHPSAVSVPQNGSASFSAAASNTTSYTWFRDGVQVGTGSSVSANTATVGSFEYQCRAIGPGGTTWSSPATLTVTAPSQSTYQSYNDFSGELFGDNESATFSISGKNTTTGPWANGTGSSSHYFVLATADFTPQSGSSPLNQWIPLGASWTCPVLPPRANSFAYTEFYTLDVMIALENDGGIVATGTISFTMSHPGNE